MAGVESRPAGVGHQEAVSSPGSFPAGGAWNGGRGPRGQGPGREEGCLAQNRRQPLLGAGVGVGGGGEGERSPCHLTEAGTAVGVVLATPPPAPGHLGLGAGPAQV